MEMCVNPNKSKIMINVDMNVKNQLIRVLVKIYIYSWKARTCGCNFDEAC